MADLDDVTENLVQALRPALDSLERRIEEDELPDDSPETKLLITMRAAIAEWDTSRRRLVEIREALMSGAELRQQSASVVEAMLLDLEDLHDDAPPPEWCADLSVCPPTAGELRARLRATLAEISNRDA